MAADDAFYKAVLAGIRAPQTSNNLRFLYAWRQAEGGSATYNPFNTTWNAPGSTVYNSHRVRNYPSAVVGVDATVKTLLMTKYAGIAESLKADSPPLVTAAAVTASDWGTGPLTTSVLLGYAAGASPKPPAIAVPVAVFVPSAPEVTEIPVAPETSGDNGIPVWVWLLGAVLAVAAGTAAYGALQGRKSNGAALHFKPGQTPTYGHVLQRLGR